MGACARNMYSDSAEIKPAQCCIKLVFHLTYTTMHGSTKLKIKYGITKFKSYKLLLTTAMTCTRLYFSSERGLYLPLYTS